MVLKLEAVNNRTQKDGLSARWSMVLLMCIGISLAYSLRVNMSVAVEDMQDELGWTNEEKGWMLSAFYWGYAIGQIPSVLVATIFPKIVFGVSIFVPSALSIFMPTVCRYEYRLALLLRGVIGLFGSATFPAVYNFFIKWVPKDEKALMISSTMSGMYFGEMIGFSVSGLLTVSDIYIGELNVGGWPGAFYLFGTAGLMYVPVWLEYSYNGPEEHPLISEEEMNLLKSSTAANLSQRNTEERSNGNDEENTRTRSLLQVRQRNIINSTSKEEIIDNSKESISPSNSHEYEKTYNDSKKNTSGPQFSDLHRIPWRGFFTNPVALTCIANAWNFGWIGFMMLSEMPAYLCNELGFDLEIAGVLSLVPYACMFVSVISFASFFEHLQFKMGWSVTSVRHCAMVVAFGGASGLLLFASYSSNAIVAFAAVALSQASLGAVQSGLGCSFLEIAPNFSALLNTVANMFAAFGGVVSPVFVAFMVNWLGGDQGWRMVFWYTLVQSTIAVTLWIKFFQSEVIPELNEPVPTISQISKY